MEHKMEYRIITSPSPTQVTEKVNELIEFGWKPIGSHHVVVTHSQNRYSGSQHMDTIHKTEYSQTMVKELKL